MVGGKAASNLQVPTYLLSYPTLPWYIEYGFGLTGEGEEEFTRFIVEFLAQRLCIPRDVCGFDV